MDSFEFKEIPYQSGDYKSELDLRDKVLRKPLGMSLFSENLENEKHDRHFGAFSGGKLVGTLILSVLTPEDYKMRQVAVDEEYQRKGVGKGLVRFAETYATQKGALRLTLHARKTAVEFYEKLGYEALGNEFTEINIPHKKMFKILK